jgi:hypothetical protein
MGGREFMKLLRLPVNREPATFDCERSAGPCDSVHVRLIDVYVQV